MPSTVKHSFPSGSATVKHTKGFIRLVSKSLYLVGLNGRIYAAWCTPYGVRYRKVR